MRVQKIGRDNGIGHPGFIFQAEEQEPFSGSWTLPRDHASTNAQTSAAGNGFEAGGGINPQCLHFGTTVSHRVRPDSKADAVEVGDQSFFMRHAFEWRWSVGFGEFFQKRPGAADGLLDLPESVAAVKC